MRYEDALLLSGEKWSTLSYDQKVEVLQSIENKMAQESQREACTVEGKFLPTGPDGIVMGEYKHSTKTIHVNDTQFEPSSKYGKDSSRLMETCLHEGRHSYQKQCVDGLVKCDNPELVESWKNNFDKYISYKENPRAYYTQPVEVDARSFAQARYEALTAERNAYIEALNQEQSNDPRAVFDAQMAETESYSEFSHEALSEGFSKSLSESGEGPSSLSEGFSNSLSDSGEGLSSSGEGISGGEGMSGGEGASSGMSAGKA